MSPKRSESASARAGASVSTGVPARKPWKKKTPVEVILEQSEKLRTEIAEGEEDLKLKRKQLEKFQEACKIFQTS